MLFSGSWAILQAAWLHYCLFLLFLPFYSRRNGAWYYCEILILLPQPFTVGLFGFILGLGWRGGWNAGEESCLSVAVWIVSLFTPCIPNQSFALCFMGETCVSGEEEVMALCVTDTALFFLGNANKVAVTVTSVDSSANVCAVHFTSRTFFFL